jgi:hypothetical protein
LVKNNTKCWEEITESKYGKVSNSPSLLRRCGWEDGGVGFYETQQITKVLM